MLATFSVPDDHVPVGDWPLGIMPLVVSSLLQADSTPQAPLPDMSSLPPTTYLLCLHITCSLKTRKGTVRHLRSPSQPSSRISYCISYVTDPASHFSLDLILAQLLAMQSQIFDLQATVLLPKGSPSRTLGSSPYHDEWRWSSSTPSFSHNSFGSAGLCGHSVC